MKNYQVNDLTIPKILGITPRTTPLCTKNIKTCRESLSRIKRIITRKNQTSISPLSKTPEPDFIDSHKEIYTEVNKMIQNMRKNRQKFPRELSPKKPKIKEELLLFENQEMPSQLAMMNHFRREIVNEVIHFKHRDLTPERLEEIRHSLTPTIVQQMHHDSNT